MVVVAKDMFMGMFVLMIVCVVMIMLVTSSANKVLPKTRLRLASAVICWPAGALGSQDNTLGILKNNNAVLDARRNRV